MTKTNKISKQCYIYTPHLCPYLLPLAGLLRCSWSDAVSTREQLKYILCGRSARRFWVGFICCPYFNSSRALCERICPGKYGYQVFRFWRIIQRRFNEFHIHTQTTANRVQEKSFGWDDKIKKNTDFGLLKFEFRVRWGTFYNNYTYTLHGHNYCTNTYNREIWGTLLLHDFCDLSRVTWCERT